MSKMFILKLSRRIIDNEEVTKDIFLKRNLPIHNNNPRKQLQEDIIQYLSRTCPHTTFSYHSFGGNRQHFHNSARHSTKYFPRTCLVEKQP